ncbi:MAG TPA: hypothetical protein VH797_05540 [Nitrososphaeraceae archaeon]|jgi:plastocyanin
MGIYIITMAILLGLIITVTGLHVAFNQIHAQTGSMSTLQNIDATYAVSIVPGAAQKESTYHYYPPKIAVPTGTTVAWFNNDFGQPHTVTSGRPNSTDQGSEFHSGLMPATANSFFQFTFTKPGEVLYHCNIHPWRVASVTASDAFFTGDGFKIDLGSGATWNLTTYPRTLLNIQPQSIPLDRTTPIVYNVTIGDGQTSTFSRLFSTAGQSLPLELVLSQNNQTTSYGPDFSSAGAYHIQSVFKKGASYPLTIEIVSINNEPPQNPMKVVYPLKTS